MTAWVCCRYMGRKLWQGQKEEVVHDVVRSAACKTTSDALLVIAGLRMWKWKPACRAAGWVGLVPWMDHEGVVQRKRTCLGVIGEAMNPSLYVKKKKKQMPKQFHLILRQAWIHSHRIQSYRSRTLAPRHQEQELLIKLVSLSRAEPSRA